MRAMSFVLSALALFGCAKQETPQPNVQITPSEVGPATQPAPGDTVDLSQPPVSKSLLSIDFAKLWTENAPKQPAPTAQPGPDPLAPLRGHVNENTLTHRRVWVFSVPEPTAEARARLMDFVLNTLAPTVATVTGTGQKFETLPEPLHGWKATYPLARGTGTLTVSLLPPAPGKDIVDSVFPSADDVARSYLVTRLPGESFLVMVVEEK
jgi:hypothetical protein